MEQYAAQNKKYDSAQAKLTAFISTDSLIKVRRETAHQTHPDSGSRGIAGDWAYGRCRHLYEKQCPLGRI